MKILEKHKKYLEKHYPDITDEQREKLIKNLYRLANYSFDEYIKKVNKKCKV